MAMILQNASVFAVLLGMCWTTLLEELKDDREM